VDVWRTAWSAAVAMTHALLVAVLATVLRTAAAADCSPVPPPATPTPTACLSETLGYAGARAAQTCRTQPPPSVAVRFRDGARRAGGGATSFSQLWFDQMRPAAGSNSSQPNFFTGSSYNFTVASSSIVFPAIGGDASQPF